LATTPWKCFQPHTEVGCWNSFKQFANSFKPDLDLHMSAVEKKELVFSKVP
jgi:hypothetical protein